MDYKLLWKRGSRVKPEDFETLEDLFRELDINEFKFYAEALASYRKALLQAGFNSVEAFKLVESYSKFIYDMSIEDFVNKQMMDEYGNGDVDPEEDT